MNKRKLALAAACATVGSMGTAAAAQADSAVYYEGTPFGGIIDYNRHSLTETSVRSLSGGYACTTAYDSSTGNRAGEPYCTTAVIGHPYCGCVLRYPASSAASATIRSRRDY